jgi:hypothetical protein
MGLVVDESPTLLRGSDRVRHEMREHKCLAQQKQAKKMMKTHQKDLKEQGAGIGAVVVVSVDMHAVSHTMGIVGIIYQMKDTVGAQIATAPGILSTGTSNKKGTCWIESNQYVVKAGPKEECNISPVLARIRSRIISGKYDNDNPPLVTIQGAHKAILQSISPAVKGKCGCKGGTVTRAGVDASRRASKVPAAALAMVTARAMLKMVIKFSHQ